MALLDTLPQELADVIFNQLPLKSLVNLSQLNRAIHDVVTPLLYRSILLVLGKGKPAASNATKLMRTLLEKPAYAEQVKEFTVRARSSSESTQESENPGSPHLSPLTDDLRRRVVQSIDEAKLPNAAGWETALCDNQSGFAQSAFILALCSNLESLVVDAAPASIREDWFSKILYHSLSRTIPIEHQSWLDNLSCIRIGEIDAKHTKSVSPRLILLALSLPKLTEFELWGPADLDEEYVPVQATSAPLTSGYLTTLKLHDTTLQPGILNMILRENPQMTRLVCSYFLPASQSPLELNDIQQALVSTSKTLTYLVFKYVPYSDDATDIESAIYVTCGDLGTFRQFKGLIELNISLLVLFGQAKPDQTPQLGEVLPPNIERLIINDNLWGYNAFYQWDADRFLSKLSAFLCSNINDELNWRHATTSLREIVFDFQTGMYTLVRGWGKKERMRELRALCESQGLLCTILLEDSKQA